ncbi:MAG TPA: GNAT family N-acetyltransferase, partial [Burkholderiaceae bacterium]|nr:GNAT family N-acetyltransferase [Burkholderiaceae bacterium]
ATFARHKAALFDWQYLENPAPSRAAPLLVGTVADAVVAAIGTMPVSLTLDGTNQAGAWLVDFYVRRDQRGRGLGMQLIEQAALTAPVVLAFGISDMSDPLFETAGWPRDSSLETMFFHSAEVGLKGAGKNLVSRIRRFAGKRRDPCEGIEFRIDACGVAHELDALWSRVARQYGNAVRRDGTYLMWRYAHSPLNSYRWVTVRRGSEIAALMVTRHHAIESVIADYVGPLDDAELLTAICERATGDLASSGTRRVRCETTHPAIKQSLESTGYRRFRSGGRLRVHSSSAAAPLSPAGWFIMTGDSDNDFMPP